MPNQRTRPRRLRPDAPVDVSLDAGPLIVAVLGLALPLAVVITVLAAIVPVIPWWVGPLVSVAVAGAMVARRLQTAHDVVVAGIIAEAPTISSVRLSNMVQGLALAAGVEEPDAVVVEDEARNAAVVAHNDSATVVVTRGLVTALEPVELEGAVAELLVRLRNGDAEAATLLAAVFRLPILGPLSALVTGPLAPVGADRLLTEERDLDADLQAVALTRYPPGLLHALTKARSGESRVAAADPALDSLWLIPPATNTDTDATARAALDLRIDVLTEL